MSTATVNIVNNSGRQLDAVSIYHSPTEPQEGMPLESFQQVINATNLANGASTGGTANLSWGDPEDFWLGGVRFHGDGETYVICGVTYDPYKEYEVSSGDTLTITIPAYEENSTNQGDATFDTGGDPGTAHLMNSTASELISWGKMIADIVSHIALEKA